MCLFDQFHKFKLSEHGDPFGSPSSNAGVIREGRPFRGEYFWNTEIAERAVNGARSFLGDARNWYL